MFGASSGPAFARAAAYRSEPIYRLTHKPTLLASPHLANRNAKHRAVKGRERQDMIGSMSFWPIHSVGLLATHYATIIGGENTASTPLQRAHLASKRPQVLGAGPLELWGPNLQLV